MSFLNRLRFSAAAPVGAQPSRHLQAEGPSGSSGRFAMSASPVSVPVGTPAGPAYAPRTPRPSNGLKEFLWHLDGVGHGQLLDVGPAWQHTVGFFIERGFRVYSEDVLSEWQSFRSDEEAKVRALGPGEGDEDMTPAGRAERFVKTIFQQQPGTLDGILLWDSLDYFDSALGARVVSRVTSLVRDGGVVLALFHSRKPESFHRYRVLDSQNLEFVGASCSLAPQRIFQNREIQDLFSRFRSSKTFVGRDQVREGLFIK
ncbi:MAG: hypothetical protein WBF06_16675 [Candidatus Acidiferrales bacterium]